MQALTGETLEVAAVESELIDAFAAQFGFDAHDTALAPLAEPVVSA